jgi:hypothetical protein
VSLLGRQGVEASESVEIICPGPKPLEDTTKPLIEYDAH